MPTTSAAGDGNGRNSASTRPLRADAERNRDRILEAAELAFATEGTDVHVETIAERAGVGVGTLYRHFLTKQKLFEAVLHERLSALVFDAQQLIEDEDSEGVFFGFLGQFVEEVAAKRDLVAMMGDGSGLDEATELVDTVAVLLRRAQSVGAVRPEISATTVLSLAGAAAEVANLTSVESRDLLTVICDGLRPPSVG
jgi:AcrR family transcriptional regulator